ncbi:hypothetical protein F8388_010484 [Cannabis sativa]|uniref:Uncharacterized protein n=1 Tax=Cannabis sativa TaxID=3483 RepID=A0A7J6GT37_CANSA|nr:hypothetical protein F8388_010484 [Cannabis sativa]KAF4397322.1 hypothetical protein G4B88_027062 [Cannabis sativa]
MGMMKTLSLKKTMIKELWPWRFSGFKWKGKDSSSPTQSQLNILDDVVFKILYVVEAVVLVSTLYP